MTHIEVLRNKIIRNSLWVQNVPFGYQLSAPFLSIEQDDLCVSFWAYRMVITEKKSVAIVFPRYYLKLKFPFNKVIAFEDMHYFNQHVNNSKPIEIVIDNDNINKYNSLMDLFEEVMKKWPNEHNTEEVKEYKGRYDELMNIFGIEMFYRGYM